MEGATRFAVKHDTSIVRIPARRNAEVGHPYSQGTCKCGWTSFESRDEDAIGRASVEHISKNRGYCLIRFRGSYSTRLVADVGGPITLQMKMIMAVMLFTDNPCGCSGCRQLVKELLEEGV